MDSMWVRTGTGGRRRGIALVTVLLVLLVLTLLGTAAVFTASTELDIAGNGRRELTALSVAEGGIHEALARLNMETGAAPTRITPGESPPGTPDPSWSVTIVKGTPGANQVRTLTAGADPATELPISTTVAYKREDAAEVPFHCNGTTTAACNNEVVRFHEDFRYAGTNVPKPPKTGPAVLTLRSTYTDPTSATSKTVVVDIVRSLAQASTPGTIRACGPVNCTNAGKGYVDAADYPGGVGIVQGSGPGSCGSTNVVGGGATPVQTTACPSPASNLFEETFGMPAADMKAIADINATAPYSGPPSGTAGKIIWVSGSALSQWNGNMTIGSQSAPVVVVFEGGFQGQGTITVWGVMYVMGAVTGTGNMKINGALIAEGAANLDLTGSGCSGGGSPTSCIARYDPTVMDNLSKLSPFTTIVWKD